MLNLEFKNKTIIVCNNSYKEQILKEFNDNPLLFDVKFFSRDEFLNHYFFWYDEVSIAYLMKKYNYSYDIALTYLKNLIYIREDSSIRQLHFLYKLKSELLDKGLLYYDKSFKDYIKDFDIMFVGFPYFTLLEEEVIKELKGITNVYIIEKKIYDKKIDVIEAGTIDEEVNFVAYSISKLYNEGVSLDKIKLANLDLDYVNVVSKIFSLYGIPINYEEHFLYSLDIAKYFLSIYDDLEMEEVINKIKNDYDEEELIKKIVDIVNKYVLVEDKKIKKELIINDFKKTSISFKYSNAVRVIDYLNDYIDDNDYVFLLNFNQNIPISFKDEDYITDYMKDNILIDLVSNLNKKVKDATKDVLKSINNLVITYKKATPFSSFYPSNLIGDMNLDVSSMPLFDVSYSDKWNSILLANYLSKFINYGESDDNLAIYYKNFPINYLEYDNKFKGVDDYKCDDLVLSYTSMNDYYLCGFKYYVSKVLKLDIYEDNFAAYIGSLFHYVLQKHFMDGKSVEELINLYISDNPLKDAREEFFISLLKDDIYFVVNAIKEQLKECSLDLAFYEKRIEVEINERCKITFKGFIDKMLYHDYGDKCIVAIIDYKTGNTDINLDLLEYGLSMQLPVYLYLASNLGIKNISFAGFYLQKILHDVLPIDTKNSLDSRKLKNLRLSGYSNSDTNILYEFDHSYKDSRVINSLKVKNDGDFYSYSKVLSDDKIEDIISVVDRKIRECGNNIALAKFDINPKSVKDVNISCTYCKFRDICYKKYSDIVKID